LCDRHRSERCRLPLRSQFVAGAAQGRAPPISRDGLSTVTPPPGVATKLPTRLGRRTFGKKSRQAEIVAGIGSRRSKRLGPQDKTRRLSLDRKRVVSGRSRQRVGRGPRTPTGSTVPSDPPHGGLGTEEMYCVIGQPRITTLSALGRMMPPGATARTTPAVLKGGLYRKTAATRAGRVPAPQIVRALTKRRWTFGGADPTVFRSRTGLKVRTAGDRARCGSAVFPACR